MYEYIFLGIVAVDEPIAALHVEPLDGSGHFVSCTIKNKYLEVLSKLTQNANMFISSIFKDFAEKQEKKSKKSAELQGND